MDPLIQYLIKLGMSPYEAFEYARRATIKGRPKTSLPGQELPGNIRPLLNPAENERWKASQDLEKSDVLAGNYDEFGHLVVNDPWNSSTVQRNSRILPDTREKLLAEAAALLEKEPEFIPSPIPEQKSGKRMTNPVKDLLKKIPGKSLQDLINEAKKREK